MLRIGTAVASGIIVADTEEDLARLAVLDVPPAGNATWLVLGPRHGEIVVAGSMARIVPFHVALGTDAIDRLEAEAYALTDALLAALASEPAVHAVAHSAYHEIATNWLSVMIAQQALAGASAGVLMVGPRHYEAFAAAWPGARPGQPAAPAPGALVRLRRRLSPLRRAARLAGQMRAALRVLRSCPARELVLITSNDSGSGINIGPLRDIEAELSRLGVATLVLTEVEALSVDARARGRDNVIVIDGDQPVRPPRLTVPRLRRHGLDLGLAPPLPALLDAMLAVYWPKYATRHARIGRLLNAIARTRRVCAVLSIPETLPISVSTGLWARKWAVPWMGHFTATIGRCPDHYFFPADEHLAYGDQLRDHIVSTGKPQSAVTVVGCPTFDGHRGRDRVADRLAVEAEFPRARGKRLVTVATEAFPDPETELVPILTALAGIPGIHVVLKLHPDDSLETMSALAAGTGVREAIDIVGRYRLGQLLAASDLLVSIMSTIVIEAAVVGTPTLCCDFSGKTRVLDFVEQGLALGCREPGRLRQTLVDLLGDEAALGAARQQLEYGLQRFHHPNDGRSAARIAAHVARRAGLLPNASAGPDGATNA